MADMGVMHVLSAGSFRIMIGTKPIAEFSELGGIKSSMGSVGYTFTNGQGSWSHARQFGAVEPPEVSLKKGVEYQGNEGALWAWHLAARSALTVARVDMSLVLMGTIPEATDMQEILTLTLHGAWPKAVNVDNAKAGGNEIINFNCTFTCNEITWGDAINPASWMDGLK